MMFDVFISLQEEKMIKFSIVIVSFNPGIKLRDTVLSILSQNYKDYEIIIKDAGSSDESLEFLPSDNRIKIIKKADSGIYDAMNQAITYISGDYILFLNCGDWLYDTYVLKRVSEFIEADCRQSNIYYGDNYVRTRDGVVVYPEKLTNYQLMTTTVCHQCIFFIKKIFDICQYQFRDFALSADMALYVRCIKEYGMIAKHMHVIVTNYESDGVSETYESRKQIVVEKKIILQNYLSKGEYRKAKFLKLITLKSLKEKIGCSKYLHGIYEKIASFVLNSRRKKYEK